MFYVSKFDLKLFFYYSQYIYLNNQSFPIPKKLSKVYNNFSKRLLRTLLKGPYTPNLKWKFGLKFNILRHFKLKKIILARDPFGQKPLYYFNDNQSLIISSEIKPIQKFKKLQNIGRILN